MKIIILFSIFIISGCSALTFKFDNDDAVKEAAIYKAIYEFSKTRAFKRDSVFSIKYHDSVYFLGPLIKENNIYRYLQGPLYEGVVVVEIIPAPEQKFLFCQDTNKNIEHVYPTRFMISSQRLFYWDLKCSVGKGKIIDILDQYGLLKDDENGLIVFLDNPIDDSKKGTMYYFNRDNIYSYKRVRTSIGIDYYHHPKIKRKL